MAEQRDPRTVHSVAKIAADVVRDRLKVEHAVRDVLARVGLRAWRRPAIEAAEHLPPRSSVHHVGPAIVGGVACVVGSCHDIPVARDDFDDVAGNERVEKIAV